VVAGVLFGTIFGLLCGMNLKEKNGFLNLPPTWVLMKTDEIGDASVPAYSVKE